MTFAHQSLSEKIHAAVETYKRDVLLPAVISPRNRRKVGEELDTIITAFCNTHEKRNNLSTLVSWNDSRLVIAGQEISQVTKDPAFVSYLLYQHFGRYVSLGKIKNLASWSNPERSMEVLKAKVDLSNKVRLTITPPPVKYRLEPLQQDYHTCFGYQMHKNIFQQVEKMENMFYC